LSCGFVHNSVGIDLGTAGDCHIFGGGFGHNETDIAGTAWTATLSVTGARFEMKDREVALAIGGVHTVAVRNCTFVADPIEIPKHPIIQGATSLTLENCFIGQPGQEWLVYDFGSGSTGKYYRFVAINNVVRGKLLQISPGNSAVDGLSTIIDGNKGEVVWPNVVLDTVAGQGHLAAGTTRVKLTKRRNTDYSIAISSDADERLHYANKTVDGFDIVSNDPTSKSNVTWTITKN